MIFLDPVEGVVKGARGIHIPEPSDRFGQDHAFIYILPLGIENPPPKDALRDVLARNLGCTIKTRP
jgi:hypothetical protein